LFAAYAVENMFHLLTPHSSRRDRQYRIERGQQRIIGCRLSSTTTLASNTIPQHAAATMSDLLPTRTCNAFISIDTALRPQRQHLLISRTNHLDSSFHLALVAW
jgi:hypothetical protein